MYWKLQATIAKIYLVYYLNQVKIIHKNVSSELPSLNIINHLNEIYKIYAPYLKKPPVKNNIKYKPNNNIGNNIYNMNNINQVKLNRLGSGKKILPNRKLSPLKKVLFEQTSGLVITSPQWRGRGGAFD